MTRALLWLAAGPHDVDERPPCLEAVLELKPETQAAHAGLGLLDQRQVSHAQKTSIADSESHW